MSLTREELKKCLRYTPETGEFFWVCSPRRNVKSSSRAGYHSHRGNWRIGVLGKQYLAHRLAWFYIHGTWPDQIDHINGDRSDNRLINLRPATNGQNQANMAAKSNSRLGIRGVGRSGKKFVVQLRRNLICIRKYFSTLEEASDFARSKSIELHGEFSIHNRVGTSK